MNAVEELLKNNIRLPSPPAIAVRIIDVVKREDFSFSELGRIIQSDPALTGRILRLANSGLYSLPRQVGTVDKAIAVLGANALKNIALSFIVTRLFKGHGAERFDFERLWRRSITAAVAAEIVSAMVGFKSDETFITSLLQDIGIAAMFVCRSDDYLAVLDEKSVSGLPVTTVERQVFGFDHQEVGAELLKLWGLPETVYLPIRHHHSPAVAPPKSKMLCNVLQASDRLSAVYYGGSTTKNVRSAKDILLRTFGLNDDRANQLIDAVAERSIEVLSQFDIEPGRIKPFSQILQEANEELSRLNLSYEMLVMEHRDAKQKAESLAVELKAANEKLRHVAFRDGLTGLYNHRYFQDAITRELARAHRHQHPLALILFDIDNFKAVNDKYGHQYGDIVLKTIAQETVRGARTSDVAARYGGEEFAIILPETGLSGACIKAESCRAGIEALETRVDDVVVKATISVGVAAYDHRHPVSKDMLVKAADQALYRSKREGRNRVVVSQITDLV